MGGPFPAQQPPVTWIAMQLRQQPGARVERLSRKSLPLEGMGITQQPWESLMKRVANTTCCLVHSDIRRKGSAPAIDETEEMHQSLGENIVVEMTQ